MRARPLLDDATADVLGFDWLAHAVAPVSPPGERAFSQLHPFAVGEETAAQSRAERIGEVAARLDPARIEAIRAALSELPDAASTIARASLGDVLADPAFLELRRFCATIERIDALLADVPVLAKLSNAAVGNVRDVLAQGQTNHDHFYLADGFDVELATARAHLAKVQAELNALRGRESERVARELGREELGSDEFIVMRAELRGALPPGVRVLREAATYFLCTLEYGEATLAALERRDAAAEAVADAEERVRAKLSSTVRDNAAGLNAAALAVGQLDVTIAAARFAQRYRCVPAELSQEPVLAFEQARFPPLETELVAAGRAFMPLDLELDDAAVLTGPNMGGKSVALLTCGFLALCVAFGLPVPAARARVGLFAQIAWLGLGREGHVGGLLSSFAREVLALKEILSREAPRLLILVDEFARTTTPHEGKALLVALLARLRERRACGLLATHLEGVASAAGVRHFAVRGLRGIPAPPATDDIRAALAALGASMDYRIAEVSGDDVSRADAIALTSLLGIDQQFVDAAYRALVQ
jgi:DNA mismatch repair protein MutS2